ncbi:efflux RND transporter periplasmic adaptor subunit [Desulfurivibrio dismutans]|uniref:efflux RND transporter periplasmic adaptor subunit n=1 Tax=Desulfurivibrio dismutans TaxID=1398908 RepID=UPI0023DBBF83|nr:efflux RND transporter periplasmic adaptor subunit [Desulfurivibrio alkaliphilus]MDF1615322.1 efflux RND transporter periplasmic adaptor subunit [Desulfurivibrio alkaliphilus]
MKINHAYGRLLGGLLLALVLLLVLIYKPGPPTTPPVVPVAEQSRQPVRVAKVEAGSSIRELRLSGLVRAGRRTELSFEGGGRLLTRPVKTGDVFAVDQVLATIDPEPWENVVAGARARLEELEIRWRRADNEHRRLVSLAASGAASQDEAELAESAAAALAAARQSAAEELREAKRQLAATVLRAPFAGTVTAVLAEPGEYLATGRPVLSVNATTGSEKTDDFAPDRTTGTFELLLEVPEAMLDWLPPSTELEVFLPRSEQRLAGTVRSVADASPLAPSLFPVLVEFPAVPGLRPGQLAEVRWQATQQGAWLVPPAAVINPGGDRPALMRLGQDGRVERVGIELGALTGERVAVFGPLQPGDRVLVSGFSTLAAGALVEAVEEVEAMAEEPVP